MMAISRFRGFASYDKTVCKNARFLSVCHQRVLRQQTVISVRLHLAVWRHKSAISDDVRAATCRRHTIRARPKATGTITCRWFSSAREEQCSASASLRWNDNTKKWTLFSGTDYSQPHGVFLWIRQAITMIRRTIIQIYCMELKRW
jgi:hypothetical protein